MAIYAVNRKTGEPLGDISADKLSEIINNPDFAISNESLIPIANLDGTQDFVKYRDFDPSSMQVRTSNFESNYNKYEGAGAVATNIARQAANALTLGGYAAIADRTKTKEELDLARKREEYNPISTFVGQTLPYLLPVGGEMLGAAKVGTTALRIGDIATAGMQSSAAKMISTAAVDGLAQGFTAGVNEASLDNELTHETLSNIALSSLIGGVAGAGAGVAVEAISKATGYGFSKLAENLSSGKKTLLSTDIVSAIEKSNEIQTFNDISQKNLSIIDMYAQQIEDMAQMNAVGQHATKESTQARDILTFLSNDEKLLKDVTDGKIDLEQFSYNVKRYQELSEEAAIGTGYSEINPRNHVAKKLNESIENIGNVTEEFGKLSAAIEKNAIKENLDNAANSVEDIVGKKYFNTEAYSFMNDLSDNSLKFLKNYSEDSSIFNRLALEYPNADKEQIFNLIKSEKELYSQDLIKKYTHIISKEKLNLGNKLDNLSMSDIYTFADNVVTQIDDEFYNHEASLLAKKEKVTKEDRDLFFKTKSDFYNEVVGNNGFNWFGESAINRIKTKQIRSELINAEKKVKRLIGQKGDLKKINLDKLSSIKSIGMGQGKVELSRNYKKVFDEYFNVLDNFVPKMREIYPDLPDSYLDAMLKNTNQARQALADLPLINDKRVSDFWKLVEKSAKQTDEAKGHVSAKTRIVRIAHDTLEGNYLFAKMQLIGMLSDMTISKLLDSIFKAKTPAEAIAKRNKLMKKISENNSGITDKISSISKYLVNRTSLTAPLTASVTVPYSLSYRQNKNDVDERYEDVMKKLDYIKTNTDESIMKMQAQMKSMNEIMPQISNLIADTIMNKNAQIMKILPNRPEAIFGEVKLTTKEKADFLDNYDAIIDHEKMLDLIKSGNITQMQLMLFKQNNPVIFSRLRQNVLNEINVSKNNIDYKQKVKMYTLFDLSTDITLTQQNLLQQALQQQQQQQTSSGRGKNMQRTDIAGYRAQNNDSFANYEISGKP